MVGGDADGSSGDDDSGEMAAEWEAMLGSGGELSAETEGLARDCTRVLNQDEIDSLLGFDDDAACSEGGVVTAIMNSGFGGFERLPGLEDAFASFASAASRRLGDLFGVPTEVSIDNVLSMRCSDYANSLRTPLMADVRRATEWAGSVCLVTDEALERLVASAMLGGDAASVGEDGRTGRTALDAALSREFFDVVYDGLAEAFAPLASTSFVFDRVERLSRSLRLAPGLSAVVIGRFRVEFAGGSRHFDLVLPYASIDLVAERLRSPRSEGGDEAWRRRVLAVLDSAPMELEASFPEVMIPYGELLSLSEGETLPLGLPGASALSLRAGGASVGVGEGRRGDERLSVELSAFSPEDSGISDASALSSSLVSVEAWCGGNVLTLGQMERLGLGAVIELDSIVGEPLSMTVNGRPLAKAELVVVERNLGVVMKELLMEDESMESRTSGGYGRSSDGALHDVPVRLVVRIGKTLIRIGDLLKLGRGAVLAMDSLVTDDVDLLVNGVLVAKGSLVVVEDHLAVTVTRLMSRSG